MVKLTDILRTDNVLLGLAAQSKKRVFDQAAQMFANLYSLNEKQVFESLMNRERVGSTYLGDGLSIPHGRMTNLDGIKSVFIRLQDPIQMGNDKTDLSKDFFFLLADENESSQHLEALALVAEFFGDAEEREKITAANTPEDFSNLVKEWVSTHSPENSGEVNEG